MHSSIERHIIDGEYQLRFDELDDCGFSYATDPATGGEFLLNQDTLGWETLKPGQYFMARVTTAHYVVEVTRILSGEPMLSGGEIELELIVADNGLDLGYAIDRQTQHQYALNGHVVMPAGRRWQDFKAGQRFMARTNGHGCVSEITLVLP